MSTIVILPIFSFLLLLSPTAVYGPPPYNATDYILLDCGSPSNTISSDGRRWDGDVHSKFSPPDIETKSSASTASEQPPSVSPVPFMTARIFLSPFTYTFPVSPGPVFLRLYFYPATYSGFPKADSFFSVTVGDRYTLLNNFSSFLAVQAETTPSASATLIKEFILNSHGPKLNVTFSPSKSSPNSYAFVNGIEVVSIPQNLYMRGNDNSIKLVGQSSTFYVDNTTAFETLYRLNVGDGDVSVIDDTGMFRSWLQDDDYIFGSAYGFTPSRAVPIHYKPETPAYTAPEIVYTTSRTMGNLSTRYNLTWIFSVDPGFYYLLRLHFCEIQQEVTLQNQRVFNIFINNQTAEEGADVIFWSGGTQIPVFKDYVVLVPDPDGGRHLQKQDLWLAMHPYLADRPEYADAILNGLEIFKLNSSDGSLAGPNPELVVAAPSPIAWPENPKRRRSSLPLILSITGGLLAVLLLILAVRFLIYRRRRRVKDSDKDTVESSWVAVWSISKSKSTTTKTSRSSLPADLCRHFSLAEVKAATGDFDANFIIGTGGFGNVYRGYIDNGATNVVIKRLDPSSNQGIREFQTEIEMLSKLRHLHLVSLIGYCDEGGEMILVYDYMARGTLREHLHKTHHQDLPVPPPLSWKQRLQICIGAARGLHYLHTGASHTIIHRDVKSTNILLDEKWVAKVSDFGLSKMGPMGGTGRTHVSTEVKGSLGYLDPEYYKRQRLTEKSDVYSFGVVLFEVLCARPAIVPGLAKDQVSLAEWARRCCRNGTLDQMVDPNLRGEIAEGCLRKFCDVADSCLRDHSIERPAMSDVVWGLEFALHLQEASEIMSHATGTMAVPFLGHGETSTTNDDDVFSESVEHASGPKSGTTSDGSKWGSVSLRH